MQHAQALKNITTAPPLKAKLHNNLGCIRDIESAFFFLYAIIPEVPLLRVISEVNYVVLVLFGGNVFEWVLQYNAVEVL